MAGPNQPGPAVEESIGKWEKRKKEERRIEVIW